MVGNKFNKIIISPTNYKFNGEKLVIYMLSLSCFWICILDFNNLLFQIFLNWVTLFCFIFGSNVFANVGTSYFELFSEDSEFKIDNLFLVNFGLNILSIDLNLWSFDIVSGLIILILYPFFWEGSWFLFLFEKNLSLTLVFLGLNNLFTIEGDGNCLCAGDWNLLLRDASIFFNFCTMFLMFILMLNVLLSNIQLIEILFKFLFLITKININTNSSFI